VCAHQHAACAHLGTQSHTLWAALPRTHTHASTAVRAAARCTSTRARVPRRPATIRRRARPWQLRIWSLWLAAALQQVRLRGSPGPGHRFGVCADWPRALGVCRVAPAAVPAPRLACALRCGRSAAMGSTFPSRAQASLRPTRQETRDSAMPPSKSQPVTSGYGQTMKKMDTECKQCTNIPPVLPTSPAPPNRQAPALWDVRTVLV
jgi:hypothetical protein